MLFVISRCPPHQHGQEPDDRLDVGGAQLTVIRYRKKGLMWGLMGPASGPLIMCKHGRGLGCSMGVIVSEDS